VPTWGELLQRLQQLRQAGDPSPFDSVRRQALAEMAHYTGRNVILYSAGHLQKPMVPPELVSITGEDMEGFMEVAYGLTGPSTDLILHSPGGRAEATEAIVNYLRSKFSRDIRVFVPHEAMSAATMLACAANRIVMGRQSYLGPVDPQFQIQTPLGVQVVPAQAILDQFERARQECTQDRTNLAVWVPMLQQYGPALLEQCQNALRLSKELVSTWLSAWMLRRTRQRFERAAKIADELSDHQRLRTHGRPLHRVRLRELGLRIDYLEADQTLQDLVLTVHHATMHTFSATNAAKIIENHMGRAFIKQFQIVAVQPSGPPPAVPPASPAPQS